MMDKSSPIETRRDHKLQLQSAQQLLNNGLLTVSISAVSSSSSNSSSKTTLNSLFDHAASTNHHHHNSNNMNNNNNNDNICVNKSSKQNPMGSKLKTKAVSFKAKLKNKLKKVKSSSSSSSSESNHHQKYQQQQQTQNCIETINEDGGDDEDYSSSQINFVTTMYSQQDELSQENYTTSYQQHNHKTAEHGGANNKEDLRTFLSTITKLMDKSLGWLKIKSNKSAAVRNKRVLEAAAMKNNDMMSEMASGSTLFNELRLNHRVDYFSSSHQPGQHQQQIERSSLFNDALFKDSAVSNNDIAIGLLNLNSTPTNGSSINLLKIRSNLDLIIEQQNKQQQQQQQQMNKIGKSSKLNYSTSTRKKPKKTSSNKKNTKNNKSYLISNVIPAMSSSFDLYKEKTTHSTPTKSILQHFSPIHSANNMSSSNINSNSRNKYYDNNNNSTCSSGSLNNNNNESSCSVSTSSLLSSSSATSSSFEQDDDDHQSQSVFSLVDIDLPPSLNDDDDAVGSMLVSSRLSPSRRRLSFGVTSSPKSSSIFSSSDLRKHLKKSRCSIDFNDGQLYALDEMQLSCGGAGNAEELELDYKQRKLIDQLNVIKENVKIGVVEITKKKKQQRTVNESISENEIDENDVEDEEPSATNSKRRKLKQIFQIKLQKQLNEIKRWQIGIKSEYEAVEKKNQNRQKVSLRMTTDKKRSSSSTHHHHHRKCCHHHHHHHQNHHNGHHKRRCHSSTRSRSVEKKNCQENELLKIKKLLSEFLSNKQQQAELTTATTTHTRNNDCCKLSALLSNLNKFQLDYQLSQQQHLLFQNLNTLVNMQPQLMNFYNQSQPPPCFYLNMPAPPQPQPQLQASAQHQIQHSLFSQSNSMSKNY